MRERLVNLFFNVVGTIPYYLAYILGALIKITCIGFHEGWEHIKDEPEPSDEDIQREIL